MNLNPNKKEIHKGCLSLVPNLEDIPQNINNVIKGIKDKIYLFIYQDLSTKELFESNNSFVESRNTLVEKGLEGKSLPYLEKDEKYDDLLSLIYLYNFHSVSKIDIDDFLSEIKQGNLSNLQYFYEEKIENLEYVFISNIDQIMDSVKEILELINIINCILSKIVSNGIATNEIKLFINIFDKSNKKIFDYIIKLFEDETTKNNEISNLYTKLKTLTKNTNIIYTLIYDYNNKQTNDEIEEEYNKLLIDIKESLNLLNFSKQEKNSLLYIIQIRKEEAIKRLKVKIQKKEGEEKEDKIEKQETIKLYTKLLEVEENNRKISEKNIKLTEENIRLEEVSIIDGLTGAYNRRHLDEILLEKSSELLIKDRRRKPESIDNGTVSCVLLLDIDDFKNFNDKYGHKTGDEVLIHLTKVIKGEGRKFDKFCRYGGEEFCLFIDEIEREEIDNLTNRILNSLRKNPYECIEKEDQITISVGVSVIDDYVNEGLSGNKIPEILLKSADSAMYIQKNNGKNGFTTILEEDGIKYHLIHSSDGKITKIPINEKKESD